MSHLFGGATEGQAITRQVIDSIDDNNPEVVVMMICAHMIAATASALWIM